MEILKSLNNQGYTVIFVTHNESLSCEYAKKIVKIEDGMRVYEKKPA